MVSIFINCVDSQRAFCRIHCKNEPIVYQELGICKPVFPADRCRAFLPRRGTLELQGRRLPRPGSRQAAPQPIQSFDICPLKQYDGNLPLLQFCFLPFRDKSRVCVENPSRVGTKDPANILIKSVAVVSLRRRGRRWSGLFPGALPATAESKSSRCRPECRFVPGRQPGR